MNKKFLRLISVREMTGLSRSSIYLMMRSGAFPKNFLLGERSVGWLEVDILAWIESRVSSTRLN